MELHRSLGFVFAAVLTHSAMMAQEVVKIAPEKEAELKTRVSKFWDGFVAGKYRTSDAYVSDESKEEFFSWPKKKIKGYTIDRILYVKDGKSAKVLTFVDTTLAMMGVGSMDIKQPVETWWREEEDGWFWFQPKNELRDTPFGKMETNAKSGDVPLIPTGGINWNPDLNALMNSVKPDRVEVQFVDGQAGTEVVSFANGMPGVVAFTIDSPPAEDITFELKSKTVPRGGVGQLVIAYKPAGKSASITEPVTKIVRVGVAQTGKLYPIRVVVKPKP